MKYLLVVGIFLFLNSFIEIVDCNNGKLCDIQLLLNSHLNEAKQFKSNSLINPIETIYANTYYNVLCVTNEPVRSRNFISLIPSNNDLTQNGSMHLNGNGRFDDLSKHEIIGNKTSIDNSLFYLSTGFIINSNDIKNYTLFCRFLTINPSIYCEKSLSLIVKPSRDYRFLIFFLAFFFIVFLISTAILVNLYLRRRVNNKNEMNTPPTDFERKLSQRNSKRNSSIVLKPDSHPLETNSNQNSINTDIYSTPSPVSHPPTHSVNNQDLNNQTQQQEQYESFENYAYSIYPITDEIKIQIDESANRGIRLVNNLPQFEQKIYFYKSENLIS
jgi:hypothetical protein